MALRELHKTLTVLFDDDTNVATLLFGAAEEEQVFALTEVPLADALTVRRDHLGRIWQFEVMPAVESLPPAFLLDDAGSASSLFKKSLCLAFVERVMTRTGQGMTIENAIAKELSAL